MNSRSRTWPRALDTALPGPAKFPRRKFFSCPQQTTMWIVIHGRKQRDEALDREGYTGRRCMGYKLPTWQRGEKWTIEQCQRFIESAWVGACIGTFMVNVAGVDDIEVNDILLDGQQRLRAIERYCNSEFPIRGEDGQLYFWSELTDKEQSNFYRIPFPWIETQFTDGQMLREAYDRHNHGGTPHLESERACGSASGDDEGGEVHSPRQGP